MRQRTAKLSAVNTARQPAAGHQLAPHQAQQTPSPGYGRGIPEYSQGTPQVSWQQPVATQGYSQPIYQQPPQTPTRQFQQPSQPQTRQFQQPSQPQTERLDGASVIHRGKIQMKDAITLITLRLAKLEEMTSTPGFHSIMSGSSDGDVDGDNNISSELIESINDRLSGLENNMNLLFEQTNDLNLQFEEMKTNIQTIIDGTCIDHSDLIIQTASNQDDNVDVFQNVTIQANNPIPSEVDTNNDDDDDDDVDDNDM
jgi:hypothetical protein